MVSSASPLTPFERAFLGRVFTAVRGLYLSGGAALAVHLGHRRSLDLDLFTAVSSAWRRTPRAHAPAPAGRQ
jgi:hypothetical protein